MSRADELWGRSKAEKRLRGRIAELDRQIEELKQLAGGKAALPAANRIVSDQPAEVRALCVLLVV